jgi:hypothetical protein
MAPKGSMISFHGDKVQHIQIKGSIQDNAQFRFEQGKHQSLTKAIAMT